MRHASHALHAELDAARLVGDPAGDAVVAALGHDAWTINASLRHVHKNGEPLPEAIPPGVRRFFAEHVAMPPWFDEARARRAQAWASRHLFHVTVALFCASLPTAYGAARGARVLAATGRMRGAQLDRRVNETAQFVLDVVAENGFSPGGSAMRAIQKVRLMHAAVRGHLVAVGFAGALAGAFGQALASDEVPINQEDMLGTLFTFSIVVVRAVKRLGVRVSDDEAEDYYQLWRGVGAMLGIQPALLPIDFASACDVTDRIAARQLETSEHGRLLMATLLARIEAHVPRACFVPRALVRYLVGDRLAEQLGLPGDDEFQTKLAVFRLLPARPARALTSIALGLSPLVGRQLLEGVIAAKLGGEPPTFAMPDARSVESSARRPHASGSPVHP